MGRWPHASYDEHHRSSPEQPWDYACFWSCNSLILPWDSSYHYSFSCQLPAHDHPRVLDWLSLPGLSLLVCSGTASCQGGVGRALWACGHLCWPCMSNTQWLTQCSPEHLSPPPPQHLFKFYFFEIVQLVVWVQGQKFFQKTSINIKKIKHDCTQNIPVRNWNWSWMPFLFKMIRSCVSKSFIL